MSQLPSGLRFVGMAGEDTGELPPGLRPFTPDESEPAPSPDTANELLAQAEPKRPKPGRPKKQAEPTILWDNRQVPVSEIRRVAKSFGTTPAVIARIGTPQGQAEARLASTVAGQLALRAEQGASDLGGTAVSLASRAGLLPARASLNFHRENAFREEYLRVLERNSDLKAILGERANRIVNNATRSLTKVALTAPAGTLAVYGSTAAETFDSSLHTAQQEGVDNPVWFATKQAAIETGITMAMGRIAKSFGAASLEEALTPGLRAASGKIAQQMGFRKLLSDAAKQAGGAATEFLEDGIVSVLQQAVEVDAGLRPEVDYVEALEAGATSAVAAGVASTGRSINDIVRKSQQKMADAVKGVRAAEEALGMQDAAETDGPAPEGQDALSEPDPAADAARDAAVAEGEQRAQLRGPAGRGARAANRFFADATPEMLAEAVKPLNKKDFERITGLKKTSKIFREAFRDTINLYAGLNPGEISRESSGDTAQEGETAQDTPDAAGPETAAQSLQTDPADVVAELPPQDTSAKNVSMDRDRALLGLDPLPPAQRQSWETALTMARVNRVPQRALDIARSIQQGDVADLSDVETAGMVLRAAEIKKAYAAADEQMQAATTEAEETVANASLERIAGQFDLLSGALRTAGTEAGRRLAARKLTVNQDMELLPVLQRAKKAKGTPLRKAERDKIADAVRKLRQLEQQLEGLDANAAKDISRTAGELADLATRREKLIFQRDQQRVSLRNMVTDLRPRTVWNLARDALSDTPRAIITSLDFSAVLRQGGFLALSHPLLAAKAIPPMMQAAFSREASARINREIFDRPNKLLYQRGGLFLHKDDGGLNTKEEAYMSRMVGDWGFIAGSQRAYTTFLNRLRADTFDSLAKSFSKVGGPTVEEAVALSNFINIATGRGGLSDKQKDAALTHLSSVLFAPRYALSRFQLLMGPMQVLTGTGQMGRGTAATRKLVAQEYGRTLVGVTTLYALAMAGFDDDPNFSLTFDPRDRDFGKLRFKETRLDPLFGMAQTVRFLARTVMGQKTVTRLNGRKEVVPLRGEDAAFGSGVAEEAFRFLRTKFAPAPGAVLDVAAGENVVDDRVTAAMAVQNMILPLSIREVWETFEQHDIPTATVFSMLAILGVGLQNHETPRDRREREIRQQRMGTTNIGNVPVLGGDTIPEQLLQGKFPSL